VCWVFSTMAAFFATDEDHARYGYALVWLAAAILVFAAAWIALALISSAIRKDLFERDSTIVSPSRETVMLIRVVPILSALPFILRWLLLR
jgi:hypothetical protein